MITASRRGFLGALAAFAALVSAPFARAGTSTRIATAPIRRGQFVWSAGNGRVRRMWPTDVRALATSDDFLGFAGNDAQPGDAVEILETPEAVAARFPYRPRKFKPMEVRCAPQKLDGYDESELVGKEGESLRSLRANVARLSGGQIDVPPLRLAEFSLRNTRGVA